MPAPGPEVSRAAPRQRRWRPTRAATGLIVVATVAALSGSQQAGGPPRAEPFAAGPPGSSASQLCGVADLGRYSGLADASTTSVVTTLVKDVSTTKAPSPTALAISAGMIVTLSATDQTATFVRYSTEGRTLGHFAVTAKPGGRPPGSFALAPDGAVVAARDGSTVVSYDPQGQVVSSWDLSSAGRGDVTAVLGWSAGTDTAIAAVAFADSPRLALLGPDGEVDQNGPQVAPGAPFPQYDGTLLVRGESADGTTITVRRYSPTGALAGQFEGTAEDTSGNGGPANLERPTGVAIAPHGGYLLSGPRDRLIEVGVDGVWSRVALSGEASGGPVFTTAEQSPLVRSGDRYYFFSTNDGGTVSLSSVDLTGMDALLDAPVTYDADHAATLARLGYGAGLVTNAPYDYFGPQDTPAVAATFDEWWGAVTDTYELRYTVTGDPWADPPVDPTSGTVAIPANGGKVQLTLPAARPGPYNVDARLVEKATGRVRTATCLRYAVGAAGATFAPGSLAEGAKWGGPGALRGVQLADQLGIGSYRIQLDFGNLVPDVGATPGVANLELSSLPGAVDGQPFADIAPAARLARDRGVQLYVQVGQGGDAERAAVDKGTWGAWAAAIAAAFATGAPYVHLWAPWNEPNNTGFGDGGDYARRVLAPFAAAVRGVDRAAKVIGGNALDVSVPWYSQMIAAGACSSLDAVGIHPYTGLNRSWDEEGTDGPIGQIKELATVLQGCGANPPPLWDTESGWWSDGPANEWAQGYDVARSMLWMRYLGVEQWTYFFSEGGWGEGGVTWSLLQVQSYVKPGALAMSTISRLLAGRPRPELVTTGMPFVHAMRVGAAPARSDALLALWTNDLVTQIDVTSAVDTAVTVTDVYGGTRSMDVMAGHSFTLPVSGSPVFLTTQADAVLTPAPTEPTGTNVLASGTATASSSNEGADPAAVLRAGGAGTSPWRAATTLTDGAPDLSPWIQVDLTSPTTIDRVAVESAGIRCCTSGLRDYTVSVQTADSTWHVVGTRHDLFAERTSIVKFTPVAARAVRVEIPETTERGVPVPKVNFSGQTAGLHPAWSPVVPETSWPASVVALAAFAPGSP